MCFTILLSCRLRFLHAAFESHQSQFFVILGVGSRWSTSVSVAAIPTSFPGSLIHHEKPWKQGFREARKCHFLGISSPDSFPTDLFALRRSRALLKGGPAPRLIFRLFLICTAMQMNAARAFLIFSIM